MLSAEFFTQVLRVNKKKKEKKKIYTHLIWGFEKPKIHSSWLCNLLSHKTLNKVPFFSTKK